MQSSSSNGSSSTSAVSSTSVTPKTTAKEMNDSAQPNGELFLLYRYLRNRKIYHGINAKNGANRKKGVMIPQEFSGKSAGSLHIPINKTVAEKTTNQLTIDLILNARFQQELHESNHVENTNLSRSPSSKLRLHARLKLIYALYKWMCTFFVLLFSSSLLFICNEIKQYTFSFVVNRNYTNEPKISERKKIARKSYIHSISNQMLHIGKNCIWHARTQS